jgi:hypothetical protein
MKESGHSENPDVNRRIILKLVLKGLLGRHGLN